MDSAKIETLQRETCRRFATDFLTSDGASKAGVSLDALNGKVPLHGMREPPEGSLSGWFLFAGPGEPSEDEDFYQPVHMSHFPDLFPGILRYLGLPPGWRFLVAPDYEDVWFDKNLLEERP